MPEDFTLLTGSAMALPLVLWFAYGVILRAFGRGSLNEQLTFVRARWLMTSLSRAQKPFDAILLGHIVNSIAFFGSATMLVLAGLVTLFASAQTSYGLLASAEGQAVMSFELFLVYLALATGVLAISFFSFTYALRKLIYVIALFGALPENASPEAIPERDIMVREASSVLTEALKTFNFGIRGYYYFVSVLCLFISPMVSLAMTGAVTAILIYRQVGSVTAAAIRRYVQAVERLDEP
ncbi:MAG: DUF599 family protein [Pseudomonadota bacterium]